MTKQSPDLYHFHSDEDIKPSPALYPSVSAFRKNAPKEPDELARDPEVANMPESSDRKHTSSGHGANVGMSEIPAPPVPEFNRQVHELSHRHFTRERGRKQSLNHQSAQRREHSHYPQSPIRNRRIQEAPLASPAPLRRAESSGRDLKSSNEIIDVDAEEDEKIATMSAIYSIVTDMRNMMITDRQHSPENLAELEQKLLRANQERDRAVEHATSGDERNYKLQRELLAQIEAYEEARAGQTTAPRALSRLNRLGNSLKSSDSAIQEAWGQLSYAITNLACCLAKGKPDMAQMEDVRLTLRHVLLNEPREMDNEGGRQRMIKMFLWRVARKWWPCGGKPSGTKTAKTWKSLRAGMLAGRGAREKRASMDFVKTLQSQLRPFLGHLEDDTRSQRRLEGDLIDLFDMLKQLESIFFGAKCIYQPVLRFVPLEEPHLYDEEFMEAAVTTKTPSPASKVKVKYVLSPGLIKHGRADGTELGNRTVVVKAEVVLE
ncbi:uncharacterized protein F5Z01DRAFT_632939 [Emericellopsis atlantica]|uniref:Uncharacterized protein n=1 Tax=Emericellopsis atlantica TaxID=2614577 RepID=A0A9P8CSC1_9HYPO|nr:uncharacterized protein F5Z01DRAFT_632939 [Emericellopsis atlantica]KAG9257924.1 hypothetical protein F5Z01DRAFT_632939 [Emericellopsis atlantica]